MGHTPVFESRCAKWRSVRSAGIHRHTFRPCRILICSKPLPPFPCTGLSPARSATAAPSRPRPLRRRRPSPATTLAARQPGRPGTVPVFTAIRSPKRSPALPRRPRCEYTDALLAVSRSLARPGFVRTAPANPSASRDQRPGPSPAADRPARRRPAADGPASRHRHYGAPVAAAITTIAPTALNAAPISRISATWRAIRSSIERFRRRLHEARGAALLRASPSTQSFSLCATP